MVGDVYMTIVVKLILFYSFMGIDLPWNTYREKCCILSVHIMSDDHEI